MSEFKGVQLLAIQANILQFYFIANDPFAFFGKRSRKITYDKSYSDLRSMICNIIPGMSIREMHNFLFSQ